MKTEISDHELDRLISAALEEELANAPMRRDLASAVDTRLNDMLSENLSAWEWVGIGGAALVMAVVAAPTIGTALSSMPNTPMIALAVIAALGLIDRIAGFRPAGMD